MRTNHSILLLFLGILISPTEGIRTTTAREECPGNEFHLKCEALYRVSSFVDLWWKVVNPDTNELIPVAHCNSALYCTMKQATITNRVHLNISNNNATLKVEHLLPNDRGWKYLCHIRTNKHTESHKVKVNISVQCLRGELGSSVDLVSGLFSIFPQDQVFEVWLYRNLTKTAYWKGGKWVLNYHLPTSSFSERLKVINGSLWLTNLREIDNRLEVKFKLEPKNRTGLVKFYKTRLFVTDPVATNATSDTSVETIATKTTAKPTRPTTTEYLSMDQPTEKSIAATESALASAACRTLGRSALLWFCLPLILRSH